MAPSADTNSSPHNCPRRILLVSVPRTASNLLVRVLNVHNQPNVLTNELAGYFFLKPFLMSSREFKKSPHEWTAAERALVREAYQNALGALEDLAARAEREGKTFFIKEHATVIVNPDVADPPRDAGHKPELDFFRLPLPERYRSSSSSSNGAAAAAAGTFSPNNHTILPDEYLATWRIVFVIRHPALAWPSIYRTLHQLVERGLLEEKVLRVDGGSSMSLKWTRAMFDWCVERSQAEGDFPPPVIIDAHEVIHSPGAVLQFCQAAGLDPAALQFEWPTEDARPKKSEETAVDEESRRIFLGTLMASKGLIKDKTPATVDVEAEEVKWRAEFGDEAAKMIAEKVRDSMPDYEYLRARCVLG
ncbi:hypothetical protein VTJ49DRAFT_2292 [Mycothermus thermophilus]|uniref:Uncharacterized protein n=1 Tax=Humicola insolens TaxID=85995 RepID=A0ABR3VAH1_HUMIN